MRKIIAIGMVFKYVLISTTTAQPYTLDKNIKPTILRLIDYNGKNNDTTWKGKVNFTTLKPVKDTTYFALKGLSMYQPVYFSATSKNTKVEVRLCKNSWKKAEQSGTLVSKGKWSTRFKTEGSFGIMVVSAAKIPIQLFTWVGKPIRATDLPSPFKSSTKNTSSTKEKTKPAKK